MIQGKNILRKPITKLLTTLVSRSFISLQTAKLTLPLQFEYHSLTQNQKFCFSAKTTKKTYATLVKEFVEKETVEFKDVVEMMIALEANPEKIAVNDPEYRHVLLKINTLFKSGKSGQELEVLAERGLSLNIKDSLYWFSLHNFIASGRIELSPLYLVNIFSSILRNRSYSYFENEFRRIGPEYVDTIRSALSAMEPKHVINAMYLYTYTDLDFPELKTKFFEVLKLPKEKLEKRLSSNQLATAALLVSHILPKEDAQRSKYLNLLKEIVLSRADLEADKSNIQSIDLGMDDIEVSEGLLWQSLAYLASVYSDKSSYSEEVLKKVEQEFLRKYEKGFKIDFESASIYLSALANIKGAANDNIVSKILQMTLAQIESDGASQIAQFDGRSIAVLLNSINILTKGKPKDQSTSDLFEFFSWLIPTQKIASRFKQEDYKNLHRIYSETTQFQAPKEFLDFLGKVTEKKDLNVDAKNIFK